MMTHGTWSKYDECKETASHQAHMAVNGECPNCGAYEPDGGGMSVELAVKIYG